MKSKGFRIGVALTAVWLLVMIAFVVWGESPDKINEWGDFFAGFFAPLAFLWLVLGYLQQGEELRQSTEALRLQAEELKNSVEQQTELVKANRQSIEMQSRLSQPQLVLAISTCEVRETTVQLEIIMTNHGSTARDVVIALDDEYPGAQGEPCPMLLNGDQYHFGIEAIKEGSTLTVAYLDIQGVRQSMDFTVELFPGGPSITPVFEDE